MDLRQLSYLVAALDHGTFTRAAAEVGVSQPTLSAGLRALERTLGVALFEPAGRGVAPTDAARELAASARAVLDDAAGLRHHAQSLAARGAGRLDVVVCLLAVSVEAVLDPIARLRRERSDVSVRVTEVDDPRLVVQLVRDGRHEIGLTELDEPTYGVVERVVGTQRLVVVRPDGVRTGTRRRHGAIRPADLAAMPLIGGAPSSRDRVILDEYLDRAGFRAHYVVEVDQRSARSALVLSGVGCAVMPSVAAERLVPMGVQVADLDPPIERPVVAIRREGPLSTQADAFLSDLEDSPDS